MKGLVDADFDVGLFCFLISKRVSQILDVTMMLLRAGPAVNRRVLEDTTTSQVHRISAT